MLEVSVLSEQKKKKKNKPSAAPQAYEKHPYHQLTHTENQNTHFSHVVSRFNERNTFTGIASLENK